MTKIITSRQRAFKQPKMLRIAFSFGIGFFITVAVASIGTNLETHEYVNDASDQTATSRIPQQYIGTWGVPEECIISRNLCSDQLFAAWTRPHPKIPHTREQIRAIYVDYAGLPLRCLTIHTESDSSGGRARSTLVTKGGLRWEWGTYVLVIPMRPLWPEFIFNGLIWATVAYLVMTAPRKSVGWWRVRHGQCRLCGYSRESLAPTDICPECGNGL
jgi:hypothetical protein